MKMFYKKLKIIVVSFTLITILGINFANACSFSNNYIYSPQDIDSYYPSVDINKFLDGEYGIVGSRLGLEYLYPVYLSLNGKRLSDETKKAIQGYYLGRFWNDSTLQNSNAEARDRWIKSRELFTGNKIKIDVSESYNYGYYINCLSDAFVMATKTLKERAKIYNKEEIKIWIENQDTVFANCGNDKSQGGFGDDMKKYESINAAQNFFRKIKIFFLNVFVGIKNLFFRNEKEKNVLPEEENLSSTQLLLFDKEYQEAASLFYKKELDAAAEKFKQISKNDKQPWRGYAKIGLGRVYIRKANFLQKDNYNFSLFFSDEAKKEQNKPIFDLLQNAKEQFVAIIQDESLSYLHSGARDLLNYVNLRLNQKIRLKDGENILLLENPLPEDVVKNLEDLSIIFYRNLYLNIYKTRWSSQKEAVYNDYKNYIIQDGGDFLKWVLVWWSDGNDELSDLAIKKYQETNSQAWLVASLKTMKLNHPMADRILVESEKIAKDSSVYLTANYYRTKYFTENSEREKAKTIIDNLLKEKDYSDMPAVENYLADMRMQSSANLDDALPFISRKVVSVYYDFYRPSILDGKDSKIDKKVARLFNEYVPIDEWNRLFSIDNFDPRILEGLRLITFVRASILNRFDIADNIAILLAKNNNSIEKELRDYLNAQSSEDKKYLSILFILNYPDLDYTITERLSPMFSYGKNKYEKGHFSYHSNWWCNYLPTESDYYKEYLNKYSIENIKYLVPEQNINQANIENAIIYNQFPSNYFSETVIDYVLKNPFRSDIPEALHLVVTSANFARCGNAESGILSERAFEILHNNYPNSEWAKKTPYWYSFDSIY